MTSSNIFPQCKLPFEVHTSFAQSRLPHSKCDEKRNLRQKGTFLRRVEHINVTKRHKLQDGPSTVLRADWGEPPRKKKKRWRCRCGKLGKMSEVRSKVPRNSANSVDWRWSLRPRPSKKGEVTWPFQGLHIRRSRNEKRSMAKHGELHKGRGAETKHCSGAQ